MITIEQDEKSGYWLIKEDDVGLARTKSRLVARRIRIALDNKHALVGQRVTAPTLIEGGEAEGVVLGLTQGTCIDGCETGSLCAVLVIMLDNGKLIEVAAHACEIIPHPKPEVETTADDGLRMLHVDDIEELLSRFETFGRAVDNPDDYHSLLDDELIERLRQMVTS